GGCVGCEIVTFSLHDALPIYEQVEITARTDHRIRVEGFGQRGTLERDHGDVLSLEGLEQPPKLAAQGEVAGRAFDEMTPQALTEDRKSTGLNSSHVSISYAVF